MRGDKVTSQVTSAPPPQAPALPPLQSLSATAFTKVAPPTITEKNIKYIGEDAPDWRPVPGHWVVFGPQDKLEARQKR